MNHDSSIKKTSNSEQAPSGETRAHAWQRFRKLLLLSAIVGVIAAGLAISWVMAHGDTSIHLMLALGGGIFLSLMLGGALMGLVFLSNRSGHDDEAATGFEADDRF